MAFTRPGSVSSIECQGTLYYGDNLPVLREHIKDESVDLIYLDPPFNSQRSYNILYRERDQADSEAQLRAFKDTWTWNLAAERTYRELTQPGAEGRGVPTRLVHLIEAFRSVFGQSDLMAYIVMMAVRLVELRRVLKPSGSIYLHCDPTASHSLKLVMDAVFGPENFRNEVVWRRTNAHNDPKRFGRIHDVLLYYQKAEGAYFAPVFQPLPAAHVRERFTKQDSRGRYKLNDPCGPGLSGGDSGKPWQGFNPSERGRSWAPPRKLCERLGIDNSLPTRQKLDALLAAGRVELPKKPGNIPMIKAYLQDEETESGTALQDIWAYQPYTQGYYEGDPERGVDQDVAWLGPTNAERLGYPTQKPVGLLERIIRSSCPEGGLVLDPFCGCGTTVDAAQRLSRQWIGIDITHLAIAIIRNRLETTFPDRGTFFDVIGEPVDLAGARELAESSPYQFQWWALHLIGARPAGDRAVGKAGKQGADRGIDGVIRFRDDWKTELSQRIIVSVKAGRNLTPAMVRDLRGTLEREKAPIGVLLTMYEPTKEMRIEAERAGVWRSATFNAEREYPRIQLITIAEAFAGRRVEFPGENKTLKSSPPAVPLKGVNLTLPGILEPGAEPSRSTRSKAGQARRTVLGSSMAPEMATTTARRPARLGVVPAKPSRAKVPAKAADPGDETQAPERRPHEKRRRRL